jgi:hypothetical protein
VFACALLAATLLVPMAPATGQDAHSIEPKKQISCDEAVILAERFVRENGYTNAPESALRPQLDHESIEWEADRTAILRSRKNTLRPTAIGIKASGGGWGVAFDYVDHPGSCRVVTMKKDGSKMRMQHQDGMREYWVGPNER